MECSICFESIDEGTGSARLSCNHLFHFGCLARWVLKNQTCPYCRHQTNRYETIAEDESEDSTVSDAESQSIVEDVRLRWIRVGPGHWRVFDEVVPSLPDFDEEAHAFWGLRTLFEAAESLQETPLVGKVDDKQESQQRLLLRHRHIYDSSNDKGYESA